MTRYKNSLRNGLAATAFLAAASFSWSHGDATGIVKERMDAMSAIADSMKALGGMMRGKIEYNADVVRRAAAAISGHSGEAMTELFPEGSVEGPSEALPMIWEEWESFESYAMRLKRLAGGLEAAADNGLMMPGEGGKTMHGMMDVDSAGQSAMGEQMLASMPPDGIFMMIAKTCSSCHEQFRLKKN